TCGFPVDYPGGVKLAHVNQGPASGTALVAVMGERFVPVSELGSQAQTLQDLIEAGPEALASLHAAADAVPTDAGTLLAEAVHDAAVINPPVTLAVGLNYDEHASELSLDNDSGPVLFSLFPNSLNGHGREVPLPVHLSEEVDY